LFWGKGRFYLDPPCFSEVMMFSPPDAPFFCFPSRIFFCVFFYLVLAPRFFPFSAKSVATPFLFLPPPRFQRHPLLWFLLRPETVESTLGFSVPFDICLPFSPHSRLVLFPALFMGTRPILAPPFLPIAFGSPASRPASTLPFYDYFFFLGLARPGLWAR